MKELASSETNMTIDTMGGFEGARGLGDHEGGSLTVDAIVQPIRILHRVESRPGHASLAQRGTTVKDAEEHVEEDI